MRRPDRPCGRFCNNAACDPVRCLGPRPTDELHRAAVFGFPDDQGEPLCRFVLERISPYIQIPKDMPPRTAAWLMCNPSRASHLIDDPTAGRVVHHSNRASCPRSLVGNVWPLRTPYPSDLWPWVETCGHSVKSRAMTAPTQRYERSMAANLDALAMIAAQADIHVVAFGAEPNRRDRMAVTRAVEAFSLYGNVPLYCLGTTPDGHPLHPLARGKFAVRNNAKLALWRDVQPVLPWEHVFSDKQRVAGGWVDR
jgi:hypothetical protein